MDTCAVSNVKSVALFVVVVMAAIGIWNFHSEYTCARSRTKSSCVRTSFTITTVVLGLVLVITMYYSTKKESTVPEMNTNTTDIVNDLA